MKIQEVEIRKFRSIKNAKFKLKDITAIVGENNAGKTTVLRALNSVFNFDDEKHFFLEGSHKYGIRSNSYIIIFLVDIPEDDFFKQYKYRSSIVIKFMYSYNENRRRLSFKNANGEDTNISNPEQFMDKIKNYLNYVFIPVDRTNEDIVWNNNSAFTKLITNYVNKHTENRDTLSPKLRTVANKIHDTVLIKLEKDINKLYMQNSDVDFKVDFPETIDYTAILNNVQFSLNEFGSNYLLKEWGSGTKSLAIIAMIRAEALIENKSIILGIEEPETNLHPQAQKRFIQSLSDNLSENEVQAIFTTHSTVLVDELRHENILLVKRKKDEKRGFITSINQVSDNFFEKHDIVEEKLYNFFRFKNSEFFFSKYIVICESSSDEYVLERLIKPILKTNFADISIINLDGVRNLVYPYFLLKELDIPFSVVVDKDFFFDYRNDKLSESRNQNGLPEYKKQLTSTPIKTKVINDVFKKEELNKIVEFQNKYRKLYEYLEAKNFYSMMYCLEMDLVCSSSACEKYYDILNINNINNKNSKYLLKQCSRGIKKIENIIEVLDFLQVSKYPESFNKIKNSLVRDIGNYI